jgi:hypothetical protein
VVATVAAGGALLLAADRPSAAGVIASWPAKPKEVASDTIAKYGQPDGVTDSRLVWQNKGPWKEIILYRDEVPHQWPMPHTDLLEQSINYKPDPEKFDDLAQFDGSVIAERTKGTLAARCDKEEMNFLAVNLANDVVTGRRSVSEARKFYEETAMAFKKGEKRPYTQRLQFEPPRTAAGDPDRPAPGS